MAPNSGACSKTHTRRPVRPKASAVVSPPSPPPTMMIGRSAPIETSSRPSSLPLHTDSLDLPLEIDARCFPDPRPYRLAQRLDIRRTGSALIDKKVAMQLRHLRGAHPQPTAAGSVDELPCLATGRILEGRPPGAALDRLGRLAALGDLFHLGADRG